MKTLVVRSGPKPRPILMCPRCRRETLPQLDGPSWSKDVHRAAAHGMKQEPDPRAERIRDRKERKADKRALRKQLRVEGIIAAAKFFLDLKARKFSLAQSIDENCPECLKLQRDAA